MLKLSKSGRMTIFSLRRNRARERFFSQVISHLRAVSTSVLVFGNEIRGKSEVSWALRALEGQEFAFNMRLSADMRTLVKLASALGPTGALRGSGYVLVDPASLSDIKTIRQALLLGADNTVSECAIGGV